MRNDRRPIWSQNDPLRTSSVHRSSRGMLNCGGLPRIDPDIYVTTSGTLVRSPRRRAEGSIVDPDRLRYSYPRSLLQRNVLIGRSGPTRSRTMLPFQRRHWRCMLSLARQ
jgi:hypothetical protein